MIVENKNEKLNKKSNNLINEKSLYLLQHAYNPVNWYPWCDEAFEKAKNEDKPIFLSIGYSSCHWCHVMERESFEDNEVAEILNNNFVCIKVDREERRDSDNLYLLACQIIHGSGGWPLSVFLTYDMKPFYAGTYFPKEDMSGMIGFLNILNKIIYLWENDKNKLIKSVDKIVEYISSSTNAKFTTPIQDNIEEKAYSYLNASFDDLYGGFGYSPKFPSPHNLMFLLRYWYSYGEENALKIAEATLDGIMKGGIQDHIGFGFSRYSTDEKWLVPHFEKMLYDNALLTIAFLEAFQATEKEVYSKTAENTLEFLMRDMMNPEGGFFSAFDADSEGEEGKFYLWEHTEILDILGQEDGKKYCQLYNITKVGNFEGKNIPNLINSNIEDIDWNWINECRQKLFNYREKRVKPNRDNKILTSWNGYIIATFAKAGRILNNKKYIETAEKTVSFILKYLVKEDGRLLSRFADDHASILGFADDYTFLIFGLIELYKSTMDQKYINKAIELNKQLIELFWDKENGALFFYGKDQEKLLIRNKEIYDGAYPSANSVCALNFKALYRLTNDYSLEEMANKIYSYFSEEINNNPTAYTFLLCSHIESINNVEDIVIVKGKNTDEYKRMKEYVNSSFRPFTFVTTISDNQSDNYKTIDGKSSAYICTNHNCLEPITDYDKFRSVLN